MAFEWQHAFDLDNGVTITDLDGGTIFIGGGTALPHGSDAPIGSFYFRSNGTVWKKFSANDDDWRLWPQASEVPFIPDGNNFPLSIDDTQEAIEYAKQNAEGFPRAGLPLVYNGTLSNNDWISYSNLTADVPIPWAVTTKINELTWSNKSTRPDRSFSLEIYKVIGTVETLLHTLDVVNSPLHFGYWANLNIIFNAGEAMKIRYKDTGKNCTDLCLVPWFSRIVPL